MSDLAYMQHALSLAEKGRYSVAPNPLVGAVLVSHADDVEQIIGEGFHLKTGEPHAEVNAFRDYFSRKGFDLLPSEFPNALAREDFSRCSMYVTLEPCSHFGRTPPCADLIVKSGIRRVVVAMSDPNPKVAGAGIARLREAGVDVVVGVLEQEAEQLNPGFLSRIRKGRPFVRLKMAMSLDGRTAMASGESKWITDREARADVQRLRAEADAILSASGTVLADDPALTLRESEMPDVGIPFDQIHPPVRVLLDRSLRIEPNARLFDGAAPVWSFCSAEKATDHHGKPLSKVRQRYKHPAFDLIALDTSNIPLARVLNELGQRNINLVHVESGPRLAGHLLEARLVDELVLYIAPDLLGELAKPLVGLQLDKLSQKVRFTYKDVTQIGRDLRLTLIPKPVGGL